MGRRPFLLALLLLAAGLGGLNLFAGNAAKGEVHLLPAGFVGEVFIVYYADSGPAAEHDEQGRRVYRVPADGVVLTRLPPNDGVSVADITFYGVDQAGGRSEIPKGWLSEDADDRAAQRRVFSGSVSRIHLLDIDCRIETDSYYVGRLADLDNKIRTLDIEQYFRIHPERCPPLPK